MLAIPVAPALAQRRASSLMLLIRSSVEGRRPSKMAALRCFQIAQAVSAMMELRPFLKEPGEASAAAVHQAKKLAVSSSGGATRRHQERISCQVMRENTQPARRWSIDSTSWSQRMQVGSVD